MITNSARLLGAVALLAVSATTANAASHIFILPEGVSGDRAFADVSGEPRNANVRFVVYQQGATSARIFTVPMNTQNFATSSADLLFFANVRPVALVVAQTTDPSTPSVAVLRQRSGTARDAVTIPSSNVMLGRSFNMPLGDLTGGAAIYIGNPNPSDAIVDLQYGDSTQVGPQITVGPTSAMKIDLPSTPTQTNLLINIRSEFPVVVEAVINRRTMVVMPIGPAV